MPLSGGYFYPINNMGATSSFPSYITNAINQFLASGSTVSGSTVSSTTFVQASGAVGTVNSNIVSQISGVVPVAIGVDKSGSYGLVFSGTAVLATDTDSTYITTQTRNGTVFIYGGGNQAGINSLAISNGPRNLFNVIGLTSSFFNSTVYMNPSLYVTGTISSSQGVSFGSSASIGGTLYVNSNSVISGTTGSQITLGVVSGAQGNLGLGMCGKAVLYGDADSVYLTGMSVNGSVYIYGAKQSFSSSVVCDTLGNTIFTTVPRMTKNAYFLAPANFSSSVNLSQSLASYANVTAQAYPGSTASVTIGYVSGQYGQTGIAFNNFPVIYGDRNSVHHTAMSQFGTLYMYAGNQSYTSSLALSTTGFFYVNNLTSSFGAPVFVNSTFNSNTIRSMLTGTQGTGSQGSGSRAFEIAGLAGVYSQGSGNISLAANSVNFPTVLSLNTNLCPTGPNIVIGQSSVDNSTGSTGNIVIGLNASTSAAASGTINSALALGANALVTAGNFNTAIGPNATAGTAAGFCTALGASTTAAGVGCVAINGTAAAANAVAVGFQSQATGSNATALGWQANANYPYSTAIGQGAVATATRQIALGTSAETVFIPGNLLVSGTVLFSGSTGAAQQIPGVISGNLYVSGTSNLSGATYMAAPLYVSGTVNVGNAVLSSSAPGTLILTGSSLPILWIGNTSTGVAFGLGGTALLNIAGNVTINGALNNSSTPQALYAAYRLWGTNAYGMGGSDNTHTALYTNNTASLSIEKTGNAYFVSSVNASGAMVAPKHVGPQPTDYGINYPSSASVAVVANGVNALTFDSLGNATFAGNVVFSGATSSAPITASTVPAVINVPNIYHSDDFIFNNAFMTNSSAGNFIAQYGFPTPSAIVTPTFNNLISASNVANFANHPGFVTVAASGAASIANAYAYGNNGAMQLFSGSSGVFVWRYLFLTPAISSSATNRYTLRVGCYSGLAHDGFFAYYNDTYNSGNWALFEAVGAAEGTPLLATSSIGFNANTWHTLTIAYTGSTNMVNGWLNGTYMGGNTSPWLRTANTGILIPSWGISVQCSSSDNTTNIAAFLDRVDVSVTGLVR